MPELTIPRTTPEVRLDLGPFEPPRSNGRGPPSGNSGGGPGGGGRPGGGRPGGGPGGAGDTNRISWRWVHVSVAVFAVVVLACIVANLIPLDKYVLSSGEPRAATTVITGPHGHRTDGQILVGGLDITRISLFDYVVYGVFGHTRVIPGATVVGPGIPASELTLEQDAEAAQSVADAKAAAFRNLGYTVGSRDVGVLVLAVEPGSPVSKHLRQGNVVTSVDGVPTHDECTFARALVGKRPGEYVELAVERSRVSTKGTIASGPTVTERVRIGKWPASIPGSVVRGCGGGLQTRRGGYLGVIGDTDESFRFPVPVSVRADAVQGSSSGLAIALGVVDALSGGDLTGRRTVAAAGTISANGTVGDVSNVGDVVLTAWRDGATLLFVPATQAATARLAAPFQLRIVAVRTLAQAVDNLRRLGGKTSSAVPPSG